MAEELGGVAWHMGDGCVLDTPVAANALLRRLWWNAMLCKLLCGQMALRLVRLRR